MQAQNKGYGYFIRSLAFALVVLFSFGEVEASKPPPLPTGCDSVDIPNKRSGGFSTPAIARRFDAFTDGKALRIRMALAHAEDHLAVRLTLFIGDAWERADTALASWRIERISTRITASGELTKRPLWARYELPSGERHCVPIRHIVAEADPVIEAFTRTTARSEP